MEILSEIKSAVDIYNFDTYIDEAGLNKIKPKIIWSGEPFPLEKIRSDIFCKHSLLDLTIQEIKQKIETIIEDKKNNELFYDGQNARLEEVYFDEYGYMNVGLSSFSYSKNLSYGTNYQIISDILKNETRPDKKISGGIAINILPRTSDGKYVYGKKKINDFIGGIVEYPKKFTFPDRQKTSGEQIDYKDYPIGYTVKKEMLEELGIPSHRLEDVKIHGLLLGGLGRFVFLSTLNLNIDSYEVRSSFEKLAQKEHEDILFFDSLEEFCEHINTQSPVKKLGSDILLRNKIYIE